MISSKRSHLISYVILFTTICLIVLCLVLKMTDSTTNQRLEDSLTLNEFEEVRIKLEMDDAFVKKNYLESDRGRLILHKRLVQLFGEQGLKVLNNSDTFQSYKIVEGRDQVDNKNQIYGYSIRKAGKSLKSDYKRIRDYFLTAENLFGSADCEGEYDHAMIFQSNNVKMTILYSQVCGFFTILVKVDGKDLRRQSGFFTDTKQAESVIEELFK